MPRFFLADERNAAKAAALTAARACTPAELSLLLQETNRARASIVDRRARRRACGAGAILRGRVTGSARPAGPGLRRGASSRGPLAAALCSRSAQEPQPRLSRTPTMEWRARSESGRSCVLHQLALFPVGRKAAKAAWASAGNSRRKQRRNAQASVLKQRPS